MVLIAFFTDFFYNVIISWALYYFFASFTSKLPWTECGEWATDTCFSGHLNGDPFPECVRKERNATCSDYYGNSSALSMTYYNYPSVSRSEAKISSFNTIIDSLFNITNPLYDNRTDTVTLDEQLMGTYCDWRPNSTSPSAEYFK